MRQLEGRIEILMQAIISVFPGKGLYHIFEFYLDSEYIIRVIKRDD